MKLHWNKVGGRTDLHFVRKFIQQMLHCYWPAGQLVERGWLQPNRIYFQLLQQCRYGAKCTRHTDRVWKEGSYWGKPQGSQASAWTSFRGECLRVQGRSNTQRYEEFCTTLACIPAKRVAGKQSGTMSKLSLKSDVVLLIKKKRKEKKRKLVCVCGG